MEIRDLLRQLKPFLGPKADDLYLAYLAEDALGKKDLETTMSVYARQLLGRSLDESDAHLSAPTLPVAQGKYVLGNVFYGDQSLHPFGLREDELIQHVAVFGRSGAGKTNTLFQILIEFLEKGKKAESSDDESEDTGGSAVK